METRYRYTNGQIFVGYVLDTDHFNAVYVNTSWFISTSRTISFHAADQAKFDESRLPTLREGLQIAHAISCFPFKVNASQIIFITKSCVQDVPLRRIHVAADTLDRFRCDFIFGTVTQVTRVPVIL